MVLSRPDVGPAGAGEGLGAGPDDEAGGPPEVAVERLGYRVGGAAILSEVSFEVARGELLGIIGPNGAGKTTLFNLLTGLLSPTEGSVRFRGRDIGHLSTAARARLGMGRSFQTSLLFGRLPTLENVRLAALAAEQANDGAGSGALGPAHAGAGSGTLGPAHAGAAFGAFGPAHPGAGHAGTPLARWWRRERGQASEAARQALEAVGLSQLANVPAGALSHGDKRKLELAVLLASGARLVLLDEPMAGVNAEDVDALTRLIADLHSGGRTVLLVEHHMGVVLGLAERVAVLHHGRLLACGGPEAVVSDPIVQEAYLGEPL
jgi:branched-chain amino acid transport system ATP-binding protein